MRSMPREFHAAFFPRGFERDAFDRMKKKKKRREGEKKKIHGHNPRTRLIGPFSMRKKSHARNLILFNIQPNARVHRPIMHVETK